MKMNGTVLVIVKSLDNTLLKSQRNVVLLLQRMSVITASGTPLKDCVFRNPPFEIRKRVEARSPSY